MSISDPYFYSTPTTILGDPLPLPPLLPRDTPMSERYAQFLAGVLAQQEAFRAGAFRPFPDAYIAEAHIYLAKHLPNARIVRKSRCKRLGLTPHPLRATQIPAPRHLREAAAAAAPPQPTAVQAAPIRDFALPAEGGSGNVPTPTRAPTPAPASAPANGDAGPNKSWNPRLLP